MTVHRSGPHGPHLCYVQAELVTQGRWWRRPRYLVTAEWDTGEEEMEVRSAAVAQAMVAEARRVFSGPEVPRLLYLHWSAMELDG